MRIFVCGYSSGNDKVGFSIIAKESKPAEMESKEVESVSEDPALVKMTKAEKRLKQKKMRKEAKKQSKEEVEVVQTPQDQVLVRFFSTACMLGFADCGGYIASLCCNEHQTIE